MSSITVEYEKIEAMMPYWSGLIHDLFQEVAEWSQNNGWQITYSDTDALEERFSASPLPVLLLTVPEVPEGQIILQPQMMNGSGKGRIKMYASESLRTPVFRCTAPGEKKPLQPLCWTC